MILAELKEASRTKASLGGRKKRGDRRGRPPFAGHRASTMPLQWEGNPLGALHCLGVTANILTTGGKKKRMFHIYKE
jgi:hypothetical protein